jgi:hypothetical protein
MSYGRGVYGGRERAREILSDTVMLILSAGRKSGISQLHVLMGNTSFVTTAMNYRYCCYEKQ